MADSIPGGGSLPAPASAVAPVAPIAAPAAAIREDQIQNAVAFLTHPKVQGSPEATKRSFLERKGLTPAEIEESFKRVPSTPAPTITSQPTPVAGPGGLVTYQTQQPSTATAQSALVPHASQASLPHGHGHIVPAQPPPPEPLRWSQVVLGVGVLAAGVYAVRAYLVPYAHELYRSWTEKARLQKESQERQEAALIEAVEAMKACQEELRASSKAMQDVAGALREQQAQQAAARVLESSRDKSAEIRQDLQEIKAAMARLSSSTASASKAAYPASFYGDAPTNGDGPHHARSSSKQDGLMPYSYMDSVFGQSSASSIPPPPNGYLGMARPSSGLQASPSASSDTYGPSAGNKAPQGTGIYGGGTYGGGVYGGSSIYGGGSAGGSGARTPERATPVPAAVQAAPSPRPAPPEPPGEAAPYPPSFMDVMEMVKNGVTPPNIRSDINDTPPDPSRPLPGASAPRLKPWETAAAGSNGASSSAPRPTGSPIYGNGTSTYAADAAGSSSSSSQAAAAPWRPPGRPEPTSSFAVAPSGYNATSVSAMLAAAGGAPSPVDGSPAPAPAAGSNAAAAIDAPLFSTLAAEVAEAVKPPAYPPVSVLSSTPNAGWKPPPPPARTLQPTPASSATSPVQSPGNATRPSPGEEAPGSNGGAASGVTSQEIEL